VEAEVAQIIPLPLGQVVPEVVVMAVQTLLAQQQEQQILAQVAVVQVPLVKHQQTVDQVL
jgi:hypothetical protein